MNWLSWSVTMISGLRYFVQFFSAIFRNVFLGHTAEVSCQLNGHSRDYLYFGKYHLDCESGHHMGTANIEKILLAIEWSEEEVTEGTCLVDNTYLLYERFLDEMLEYANSHDHAKMIEGGVYPASISYKEIS